MSSVKTKRAAERDQLSREAVVRRALEIADNGFKEWVGLVAYRLAGYTDSLFPGP